MKAKDEQPKNDSRNCDWQSKGMVSCRRRTGGIATAECCHNW